MPKMAKWSDKPLGKITLVLKLLSCEAKAAPAEKKPKEKKKKKVRLRGWIVWRQRRWGWWRRGETELQDR